MRTAGRRDFSRAEDLAQNVPTTSNTSICMICWPTFSSDVFILEGLDLLQLHCEDIATHTDIPDGYHLMRLLAAGSYV